MVGLVGQAGAGVPGADSEFQLPPPAVFTASEIERLILCPSRTALSKGWLCALAWLVLGLCLGVGWAYAEALQMGLMVANPARHGRAGGLGWGYLAF